MRALRPAADRCVEHVDILLGEGGIDPAHQRRRIGRQVEIGAVRLHAGEQPIRPEWHRLDLGRARQRGEHHFAVLAERLRAVRPDRAGGEEFFGRCSADVMNDQLVTDLLQIGRHAIAHGAEPDKTDLHRYLLRTDRRDLASSGTVA